MDLADLARSLHGVSGKVGPAPETRGIIIDWLVPVYDPMCWILGAGLAMRRRTLSVAALKPGDRVLDVGCGTGVLTRLAADAVGPDGVAIGIDPGPGMIEAARRNAAHTSSRAAFDLGVIERLAFDDDCFDVVLSSFMLHHLPPDLKRAGLGEVRRVLKPGGRLVIVDFDPARPIARAMIWICGAISTHKGVEVLHQTSDPVSFLHEAGFVDVAVSGSWLGTATFWRAWKPATVTSCDRPRQ
jgi:SAM-dependent methyltransferase